MIEVDVAVEIDRPPERVFQFVADFENNPIWQSGMRSARFTSPAPLAVGSTYEQVASFLGREVVSSFEVVAYVPGRKVAATSVGGSFPITFTRQVDPVGAGSRVSAHIEGDARGFFRIARPLLRWLVRRSIRRDYANLKRILETEGR